MASEKMIIDKIESQLFKHLPGINKIGLPIKETSKELRMDQGTVKMLLKLLGYAHAT